MSSQTATILVTDLVGSTERRVALGEERAEALRRTHDRLLNEAVTVHGGTVVKGLGDGVLALFSGAAEAVGAAVAIQRAVAAHAQRHPEDQLSVRVGLSAGDVTLEDGDCFGTPVVEASRLCAEAAGDQILVADLVRLLARGRGEHEFTPAGERTLKGLPEPVPVAVVSWSAPPPDGPPLPAALRAAQWFSFAGRVPEREVLVERFKAAVAGEPALVVVSGEPGIGKTRLVSEVAAFAHDAGATVLYGRSEEELDVPFRPWAEALQHLVAHLPADVTEAHVTEWGGDITRLVPSLDAPAPHRTDADTERLRLFGAACDLLRRAGDEAPVVLVLDDLHWADESSLLLLRHLVRQQGDARLLVVGTYRDTDLSRAHPLAAALADLRREAAVERIDLGGLDRDEVVDFLTQAGGDDVRSEDVDSLAAMVWAETEGNPFFIGEVLVHLVESGALVRREGRWESDRSLIEQVGLPEGIREVIGRRLAELSDAGNDVLRAAAVVGGSFDAAVVAAVLERDLEEVVTTLDDAAARRLVVEEGDVLDRFRFAHALVRQTLLEELRTSRRVRLHHRVALALEARGTAASADLAFHFGEAAALADGAKAIEYAGQAADEAAERLAFEQAVHFRHRALEAEELLEPADPARRSELLGVLGETLNLSGQPMEGRAEFVAAAAAARAAGRPDLLVRAAVGYGGGAAPWLEFGEAVGPALAEEALDQLGPEPTEDRALCLAKVSHWHMFDPEPTEQRRLAIEAVAVADEVGDPACRLEVLAYYAAVLQGMGEADELAKVAEQMAELDGSPSVLSLYYRAIAQFIANDMDGYRASMASAQAIDAARMTVAQQWNFELGAANLALADGRFDDVVPPPPSTVASFGATGPAVPKSHQMTMCWLRGDLVGAVAIERQMMREDLDVLLPWPNDAFANWLEGHRDAAVDELRRWHREILPIVPALFRVHAVGFAARFTVDLGTAELYDELAEILRPQRGQWATWTIEVDNGLVDHALGLLDHAAGRVEQGLEELRTAIDDYRQAGTRARLTLALADLAELTDDADARAEALELAAELGMAGVTAQLTP